MIDLLCYLAGRITKEEYRHRRIKKQSTRKWLKDYERAEND